MSEVKSPFSSDRKPLQTLIPLDNPIRLEIDPSSVCNFKCDFCFQSKAKNFRGKVLTNELFDMAVEQLQELCQETQRCWCGKESCNYI